MQEIHKLIIDIGNSRQKFYYLDKVYFSLDELFAVCESQFASNIYYRLNLVSTNGSSSKSILALIQDKFKDKLLGIYEFQASEQNIITELYSGIGSDRAIKLIGLSELYPNTNILLVDFGTAMTISLIDRHKKFLGGLINLGFSSSLKALAKDCYQLEDYSLEDFALIDFKQVQKFAFSPKDSILNGTAQQYKFFLEQIFEQASQEYSGENFIKIASGGDSRLFASLFDDEIDEGKILGAAFERVAPN